MGVRLKIRENQWAVLQKYITENRVYQEMVNTLVSDLNTNYEPITGMVREDGEYFEKPMIKIKVDESEITPKALFEYFQKKYKLGEAFIKQVISDWAFGRIKDGQLTKNVSLT